MSGLFDQISRKLQAEKRQADGEDQGISAWDLARLSPPLRAIVRTMLREVELTYPELCRLVKTSPPGDAQLTETELDEALQQLLNQAWIVRMGQAETITYRVNLRRRRGTLLSNSLWEQLHRRLSKNPAADE